MSESFINAENLNTEKEIEKKITELKFQISTLEMRLDDDISLAESDEMILDLEQQVLDLENDTALEKETSTPSLIEKKEDLFSEADEAVAEGQNSNEDSQVSIEKQERTEYLQLRNNFKVAKSNYLETLKNDYKNRGALAKVFGGGRGNEMSPEVQSSYDDFMLINKSLYEFSKDSSVLDKLSQRLNRDNEEQDKLSIMPLMMDRHILNLAEQRLDVQTMQLSENFSEKLSNLRGNLVERIKANPEVSKLLGSIATTTSEQFKKHPKFFKAVAFGVGLTLNAPVAVASLITHEVGDRFVSDVEQGQEGVKHHITELSTSDSFDLKKLEAEYFTSVNKTHNYKVAAKVATVTAAVSAGKFLDLDSPEDIDLGVSGIPAEVTQVDLDDVFTDPGEVADLEEKNVFVKESDYVDVQPDKPPVVESSSDTLSNSSNEQVSSLYQKLEPIHVVESGENMSTLLLDRIQEKIDLDIIKVPEGIDQGDIARGICNTFPEMTDAPATQITQGLSNADWQNLIGVDSGNPNMIKVGEELNIEYLVDKVVEKIGGENIHTDLLLNQSELGEFPDSPVDQSIILKSADGMIKDYSSSEIIHADNVRSIESADSFYSMKEHDVLSRITVDYVKEKVLDGSLVLPNGVNEGGISHYIYQSFPEMTSATDAVSRLSAEEWVDLGVSSGNPNIIHPGETINIQELVHKMNVSPDVTSPENPIIETTKALSTDVGSHSDKLLFENIDLVDPYADKIYTVENGQFLKDIMNEKFYEVEVPAHFQGTAEEYLMRLFPEAFSEEVINPALSLEQWQLLGIDSGNPLDIAQGDRINMKKLTYIFNNFPLNSENEFVKKAFVDEVLLGNYTTA